VDLNLNKEALVMLHDTLIWNKYQKWLVGITKINEKIDKLKDEKKCILEKINDNIEETPDEMIDLQTRLHYVDQEITSAEQIKSEFQKRKPFTKEEFFEAYKEDMATLAPELIEPLEKVKKARKELIKTLTEYLKVYQDYESKAIKNLVAWEKMYYGIGNEYYPLLNSKLHDALERDMSRKYSQEIRIDRIRLNDGKSIKVALPDKD